MAISLVEFLTVGVSAVCKICGRDWSTKQCDVDVIAEKLSRDGWEVIREKLHCPTCAGKSCSLCGGELWIGRQQVVCSRGCTIPQEHKRKNLSKDKRIEHAPFKALLKDVEEGARKLAEYDKHAEAT